MNNTLSNDIIEHFNERTFGFSENERIITNEYDIASRIPRIESMVKKIINSEGELFYKEESKDGRVKLGCIYNQLLYNIEVYFKYNLSPLHDREFSKSHFANEIIETFSQHQFNPYVSLFINILNEVVICKFDTNLKTNSIDYEEKLIKKIEVLNKFIERIRTEGKSKEFKRIINNFKRQVDKNTKSVIDYINHLFTINSRLLSLRLDFRYNKDNNSNSLMTKEEVFQQYLKLKKDREQLFNVNKSNRLLEHMVGYVWKMEYTRLTGWHCHTIIFFDGSKVRRDCGLGMLIGEFWKKTITEGKGLYFNCNDLKYKKSFEEQGTLGIGMINHDDHNLRKNLEKVAEYLTKPDYYARVVVKENGRTFGRGEIIKNPKVLQRGRPRKCSTDYLHSHFNA